MIMKEYKKQKKVVRLSAVTSVKNEDFEENNNCFDWLTLRKVPDDLFKFNTSIVNFEGVFNKCENLYKI